MARVTIVTATFDRAHTLDRAIASVAAQTLDDWEHVIVDDGSTDRTAELLAGLAGDARYRCLRVAHAGQTAAVNAGAREATGAYLALLDSDDELLPHHLADSVAALAAGADLVWGAVDVAGPEALHYFDDLERPGERIHMRDCCLTSSMVVRLDVWRQLGGFRDVLSADADFHARLLARGGVAVKRARPSVLVHTDGADRLSVAVRAVTGTDAARDRAMPDAAILRAAIERGRG